MLIVGGEAVGALLGLGGGVFLLRVLRGARLPSPDTLSVRGGSKSGSTAAETPADSVGGHGRISAGCATPASECGAASFFLAFFLDDMQRDDRVGAVNVGVYITGYGAAVAWTRLGRCTRHDLLFRLSASSSE